MVDSGEITLTINEKIAEQLGLEVKKRQEVVLADGPIRRCDYVSSVSIHFENRHTYLLPRSRSSRYRVKSLRGVQFRLTKPEV